METDFNTCSILQPHYLPWIGYFEMIDRADVFVYLDDVKFIKREWKNRNKIRKTENSRDFKWLTVPIRKETQNNRLIEAIISEDHDWRVSHLNQIHETYKNTPCYADYFEKIQKVIEDIKIKSLAELNIILIELFCNILDISTTRLRSSDLNVSGRREEKLLLICKHLKCREYLANNATTNYVSNSYFKEHGIEFCTQNYTHPKYKQVAAGKTLDSIAHLSIIDLLFNYGDDSLAIIKEGHK